MGCPDSRRARIRREHRPESFFPRRPVLVLESCPLPEFHKACEGLDLAHQCAALEAPREYRLCSCLKLNASLDQRQATSTQARDTQIEFVSVPWSLRASLSSLFSVKIGPLGGDKER